MREVDISGDGEWLIALDYNGAIFIYSYSTIFVHQQTITLSDGFFQGGAISDDHQWLVFGKYTNNIYLYQFNGSKFEENQVIAEITQQINITNIVIAHDSSIIVAATSGTSIYVFRGN